MAYNPFGEDVEDFSNSQQTAEERKRKLAAIASMVAGQGLGDTAGALLGDRTAAIQSAIQDPEAALKQRMGVSSDYSVTGQQPAAIGQQPVAQMQPINPAEQQLVQQPAATQPPAVTQPAPVNPQEMTGEMPSNIGQVPTAGPGVQVAAVSPEVAQQMAQSNPQVAANMTPGKGTDLNDVYHEAVIGARNETDPQKRRQAYASLLSNENVPEGYKAMANRFIAEDYMKQREMAKAEEKISQATPNDLARYMQSKSEEGSYLKAILFQRLGLSELAKEEQQKLGAGTKMASAVDATTGERYTVEKNANGEITRAFNTAGKKAGQEEIARLSAATLPTAAHQLPSAHGSPVVNAQGETGLLMYDPQSQSTYVQVGNKRLPTAGWTTMAQNVQNVYGAAQAQKLGAGAGEGFTPQPMRPLPGGVPQAAPAAMPAAPQATTPEQIQRAQGDVAAVQRELASTPKTPANQQRIAILNQELAKAQQIAGASQGLPAGAGTQAVPGGGIAQQKANLAIQEAQQKEGIQVAGQRSQAFNKILDEEVRPQAQQGDTIVSTRKQQFAIFDRPGVDASKIFGIANGAGQTPGDQRWTMLRDTLLGKTTATDDQIRERAAALGLNREEQAALAEYNIANAKINAATLKSTAGAGSVSDAEQRANREMNVDPTKIPGLGAYNAMAQSQFEGDKARYKADWASTHPATNALQLDKAWRKESQQLTEMYTNIAKERAKFITENGATTPAVKEAYKRYPVPEYDPATETWKKTKPLAQIFGR